MKLNHKNVSSIDVDNSIAEQLNHGMLSDLVSSDHAPVLALSYLKKDLGT